MGVHQGRSLLGYLHQWEGGLIAWDVMADDRGQKHVNSIPQTFGSHILGCKLENTMKSKCFQENGSISL